VKVLWKSFDSSDSASQLRLTEQDLTNGVPNGRAVTWVGTPRGLRLKQTYRDSRIEGPVIYYGTDGTEITRCEYRRGRPWRGEVVQSYGWSEGGFSLDLASETNECEGVEFEVRGGILWPKPAPAATYSIYEEGRLREVRTVLSNGVVVLRHTGHANGGEQSIEHFTRLGRRTGACRRWNEEGLLCSTSSMSGAQSTVSFGNRGAQGSGSGRGNLWERTVPARRHSWNSSAPKNSGPVGVQN